MTPTISGGIDHVHVYVASRKAAADWYRENLGFEVVKSYAFWATPDGGPLTIADASDTIHLALFRSDTARPSSLAFGVAASEYRAWQAHLRERGVEFTESDHGKCWSTYFADPDGNTLELTCYDHAAVSGNG